MLAIGSAFSWIFRRLGLSDVVGYILGGAVVSSIMISLGVDVERGLNYLEPLRWLGLILFTFTIGASIGFHRVVENMHRAVASELMVYAVLWMVSGFIALITRSGYLERLALFVVLINSSTVASAGLIRSKSRLSTYITDRVIIQTSMEDLAQFVLFALIFAAGATVAQDVFRALVQLLIVVSVSFILIVIARYMLRFLSKTKFVTDVENKFVLVIGIAMLFASIASTLGIPPLFGAFLAGISFSVFMSLDDVLDMVKGVKTLGLLMYFISLGAQLYLASANLRSLDIIIVGITIGVIAFLFRLIGVSLAMLFTGSSVSDGISMALFLTPISEMGIVFIDVLARNGIVAIEMVTKVTVAVATSIVLFGIITPRAVRKIDIIEKFLPPGISSFFRYLSELYLRRTDVAISMLKPIIKFTSLTLCLMYLNSLAIHVIEWLEVPVAFALIFSIVLSTAILVIFILTMRNILSQFLNVATKPVGKISEGLGKMIDLMAGSLAIAFQSYIFYEASLKIIAREPLYPYITLVVEITLITITFYELIRYHIKIKKI